MFQIQLETKNIPRRQSRTLQAVTHEPWATPSSLAAIPRPCVRITHVAWG
jgi:hypothetical protein